MTGAVYFRIDTPAALTVDPEWPWWADVSAEYALGVDTGHEAAEFEDGIVRHEPTAAAAIQRRRFDVEIPGRRMPAWRQFMASAPGRAIRFRDPEDGVLRRVTVEEVSPARQTGRQGAPHWVSEVVLSGWTDDRVEG